MTKLIACVALLALARPAAAQQPADTSLYVRLGGVYAIALVVDDFVERLERNSIILANPAVRDAFGQVPKAGLKYRITELVCQATGGPCRYTGKDMAESHESLAITEAEWNAMVAEFYRSLRRFNVPVQEQRDLVAVVASTKKDIVTTP